MRPADVINPAIASDVGHHLNPHALVVFPHHPYLPGQVEVAEDIEGVLGDACRITSADQPEHGLAGGLIASPLVALEALGLHRNHRNAGLRRNRLADRLQVIANDADDAGGIDKGGLGAVAGNQLQQGAAQLFLSAEDDILLL